MPLQPEPNSHYWPFLLTEPLYLLQEDLVVAPAKAAAAPAAAPPVAETAGSAADAAPQADLFWGSLQRGVLILVEYPEAPLMDRQDGLFLVDILKAVGYEFKEVATLNISRCKTPADWAWVREQPWQKLISFGVQHPELPFTLNTSLYERIQVEGKPLIHVEPLPQIRSDVNRKKQLWNLLKGVFV